MRPLASSRSCMVGMLFETLISRLWPQKPFLIVTACTGICRNFAWGDFARFSIA